jgi:hypothetical protein
MEQLAAAEVETMTAEQLAAARIAIIQACTHFVPRWS